MVLALISQCLDIQVELEVEFVFDLGILILQLHEALEQVGEEEVAVEDQRAFVANRALPPLVLRVDRYVRVQIEALQVCAVFSAHSLLNGHHRDWAARVEQNLVNLVQVVSLFLVANVIVNCFLVAKELFCSLQRKLGLLNSVLSRKL